MPDYRRAYVPGGTYFFTLVTNHRQRLLESEENVSSLRQAIRQVMTEMPFLLPAAVILPDHAHFVWTLPQGDTNYSARIGRTKILFTRSIRDRQGLSEERTESRRKHRESGLWQRRFWEHVVDDEQDFERYLNYIHYNPVKHGLVSCPHLWPFSSFRQWVNAGLYTQDWGCSCSGQSLNMVTNMNLEIEAGE